eukprot:6814762-Heterocapsa_arctica.AAC.1
MSTCVSTLPIIRSGLGSSVPCRVCRPWKPDVAAATCANTCRGPLRSAPPRRWRTALAGVYPPGLCRAWARVAKAAAPPGALRPSGRDGLPDLARWEDRLVRIV